MERNTLETTLTFDSHTIRRIAREKMRGTSYARIFLKQTFMEGRLVLRRKVNFRKRRNSAAVQAYCAMGIPEFEGINARQKWANWRTIPKNLNGLLPDRTLLALDLCCGVGHSTEVLAFYLPAGSRIIGLEYNPTFAKQAAAREFRDREHRRCDVHFRAQSVLETFHDAAGRRISDGTVDLVNSSGAIGSHFDPASTCVLAREVERVLKPGGLALIDAGPPGTSKKEVIEIFHELGFRALRASKSNLLEPFSQICLRKLSR